MRDTGARVLFLAVLLSPAFVQAQSAAGPAFRVRADPALAPRINPYLASVSLPIETAAPATATDPAIVLGKACGSAASPGTLITRPDGTRAVRHAPCLRFATNVKVKVFGGDTRENLAVRMGLLPASEATLQVTRGPNSNAKGLKALDVGDVVIIPRVPLWTDVTLAGDKGGEGAFTAGLARALGCGAEAPVPCLTRFNIAVVPADAQSTVNLLPRERPTHPNPDPEAAAPSPDTSQSKIETPQTAPPAPVARPRNLFQRLFIDPFKRRKSAELPYGLAFAESFGRDASQVEAPPVQAPVDAPAQVPPPAIPPAPPPAPAPAQVAEPSRVAPGQWPYDAALVARVLQDARELDPKLKRTMVGIIDAGLRDAYGAPLPADSFAADVPDVDPRELRGSGAPWPTDDAGVGLCEGALGQAAAGNDQYAEKLNHGVITASLATGSDLRSRGGIPGDLLPRLTYFRAYRASCPPTGPLAVDVSDVMDGFRVLAGETEIVSISYQNEKVGVGVDSSMLDVMASKQKLLVTVAGNGAASDLDKAKGGFCPACLAYPGKYPIVSGRVFAVGAAKPDLERQPFSGYGKETVTVYAPSEPAGGLDMNGQDAGRFGPATSYAAPRVTLAAALMRELAPGVDMDLIARRLRLAVWPLYENGVPLPEGGVLDLVKAVAVRRYAVEEFVDTGNGAPFYRTWVGQITGGLKSLTFCAGETPFSEYKWQAVVLSTPTAGPRQVVAYAQRATGGSFPTFDKPCEPSGEVTLVELGPDKTEHKIPLARVTRILVPMRLD